MTFTSYTEGPASRIISLALFVVFLHACGGGSPGATATQAPTVTANAGANFLANESTPVNLDGTASSSSDNSALTYSWIQLIGINVSLSGADTATPSFVAPAIDFRQSVTFGLEVTSASGASSTDTVAVTINALPIADAGADQSVDEGTTVNLSGTGTDINLKKRLPKIAIQKAERLNDTKYDRSNQHPG